MLRLRTLALLGTVVGALLAGCAAPAAPPAAPPSAAAAPSSPSAAPSSPAADVAPGSVRITGAVRRPTVVTADQLAHLPTASVDFTGADPTVHETETGPLLADLLPPDALATTDRKNDLLSFGVLAIGADGYSALVSYGEISVDFGGHNLMLAMTENGAALARPRLIAPQDRRAGRDVSDLVELHVVRVTAG